MDTKLTLSLDKEIIERAKNYARDHNVSLSSLVENFFLKLVSEYSDSAERSPKATRKGSIVKELSGIINLEGVDYREDHTNYLETKYQ